MKNGGIIHRSDCGLPGWLPFYWTAHRRLLLPGARVALAGSSATDCRYITGTIDNAIGVPFKVDLLFNQLRESMSAIVSILGIKLA